jgi:hypothetical protein
MSVKQFIRSFSGGEITPELYGRLDLAKFQIGLAVCKNFEILPQGPAQNRAGLDYVLVTRNLAQPTKMIEFDIDSNNSVALEFGNLYLRIHTNGATQLEAAKTISAITNANPGVLTSTAHGYNNGDTIYLGGIGGMSALNGMFYVVSNVTANTFTLLDVLLGSFIDTTSMPAFGGGVNQLARVYEVVTPYVQADLFDIHYDQSANVMTMTHPNYAPMELRRVSAANWSLTAASFVPGVGVPVSVTATPTLSGAVSYTYVVTAISTDVIEESNPSATATCTNDLTLAGHFNTIAWATVSGATRYNVYKLVNGLYGFIGQAAALSFIDNNIIPDTSHSYPLNINPFSGAGEYPGACCHWEQRRGFAGSLNRPQNTWLTKSGTESNLSYTVPTRDDDAIRAKVATRKSVTIRHMVPVSDLVLMTSGIEVRVVSQNSDALTPSTVSFKPDAYEGASNVQPVVSGSSVIYAQARGGRVRELAFSWQTTAYKSNDLSVLATHLFDDYTIVDMAYTQAPNKCIWCVRSDGTLLGLSYLPEQEIAAWHHHGTGASLDPTASEYGQFKSVCTAREGADDVLYFCVKRKVGGLTRHSIERRRARRFATLQDAFFVDSGLTYNGAPTSVLTGLSHLDGQTVSILTDGAVHPQRKVIGRSVTLDYPASVVQIGIPITADLQTLPMATAVPDGSFAQGIVKNINKLWARVFRSSGFKAGPSFDKLKEYPQRTTEPYGTPPALMTKTLALDVTPAWSDDGQLCIRQDNPLPLTVSSITLSVTFGG